MDTDHGPQNPVVGGKGPHGTLRGVGTGAKGSPPQLLPFSRTSSATAGPVWGSEKLPRPFCPLRGPHQPQDPERASLPLRGPTPASCAFTFLAFLGTAGGSKTPAPVLGYTQPQDSAVEATWATSHRLKTQ